MRTFIKPAPILLAFTLALASQYAHAWKSPQKAVDEFLKFELEGGRMQWPYPGEKYLISPPANETTGKKTIALVKDYKIISFVCQGKFCEVHVRFSFIPNKTTKSGAQPLEVHAEGDSKMVTYRVHRLENSWLIENNLDTPMVYEDALKRTTQPNSPQTAQPSASSTNKLPIVPTSGRGK